LAASAVSQYIVRRRNTVTTTGLVLAAAALLAPTADAAQPRRLGDRTLHRGAHGSDVRELQRTLRRLHFRVRVDGRYGRSTERLVRRAERRVGRRPDGRVSAADAIALRAAAGTLRLGARTLRRGTHGRDVARLQRVLTRSGVPVRDDGRFGPGTERRVRRYETVYGEAVDGRVDPSEARRMVARVDLLRAAGRLGLPPAAATPATGPGVFPVQGAHTFGDGFGARGGEHQGIDILARCGLTVVAAASGTVRRNAKQSRAGNYVVLRDEATGEDHVYMHLRRRSPLQPGARVAAGAPVGEVGETGNATACHLHFEIWTAPGYYTGGRPRDPLPDLRAWGG
jgi:murein DD-endopeptidase MepM/ murein hydrolase activator NlpD